MAFSKFSKQDIDQNTLLYDNYHHRYNMEDGWYGTHKQDNFVILLKIAEYSGIPISGTSCLDVGCGSGDLSKLLRQLGAKNYVGIDLYKPSIERARQKYPKETFLLGDFLATDFDQMFDYAFCSGGLSMHLTDEDNYAFLETALRKMWQLTTIGIAFNVLIEDKTMHDNTIFFYKPNRVKQICQSIDSHAIYRSTLSEEVPQIHVSMYRETQQRP